MKSPECAFCDVDSLRWRAIKIGDFALSIVSNPGFTEGHCLVVPRRHVVEIKELTPVEHVNIMQEVGRLARLLDNGNGSGVMQKFQPKQAENGVKMNHLHFHVFPRQEDEDRLFPTPSPNSFDGFYVPKREDVEDLARKLKEK